jgi:hypothetical protein
MGSRLLILAVLAASLAFAKTYTFTLSNTTEAGSTELNAGQYKLQVKGSQVMLKDAQGHDVTAKAKVESAKQRFRDTEVSVTNQGGKSKLEWIGLAGSQSRVIFE